jgi:predicted AlkP superfamily pyrophosphatase or phosphodiesterase
MKISLRAATALLLFALAGCVSQAPRRQSPGRAPLILVSIDGYRADYIERGLSPRLAALAADGVRAEALRPAFPTLTFPNHYTLVTGLYPDHHGIVNNRMVDPVSRKEFVYKDAKTTSNPGWWGSEPIWVTAERQGLHSATMFWPGSDVAINGARPEHWLPFDAGMSPVARVRKALSWFDVPGTRPDFLTVYFEQVDHAGHDHGPDSAEVDHALAEVDTALGLLIDGLKQRGLYDAANFVIVSDHGMTTAAASQTVVLDDVVDIHAVDVINAGVLAGLAAKPGRTAEVEHALLAPHEHMRCWQKSAVPARLHYGTNARVPPLLCLADDGWMIDTRAHAVSPNRHVSRGEHGYDNDDPNMRALFVAHGPAFKPGNIVPEFDNVDVYPLLCRILRIAPLRNDGSLDAVAPMLAGP